MQPGRASRTAHYNALFRALEDRERPPLVVDPYVRHLLSPSLRALDLVSRSHRVRRRLIAHIDRRWPGARTSLAARTALIDEYVLALLPRVDQVVILGAGLDTRAYRMRLLRRLPVFEVDHPDTQRSKRQRLRRAGITTDHVSFAPVDFSTGDLDATLTGAGFDRDRRTLMLWEGVTNYLDGPTVERTLRWCATAAAFVVFTYIDRKLLLAPQAYHGSDRVTATVARAGERYSYGIDPEHLEELLANFGFTIDNDLDAASYRRREYGTAATAMIGHEFYHVVTAHPLAQGAVIRGCPRAAGRGQPLA